MVAAELADAAVTGAAGDAVGAELTVAGTTNTEKQRRPEPTGLALK